MISYKAHYIANMNFKAYRSCCGLFDLRPLHMAPWCIAKNERTSEECSPILRVTLSSWTVFVRMHILGEWQRRWRDARVYSDFPKGALLFRVRPLVSNRPEIWAGPRWLSTVCCRLRHGHCFSSQSEEARFCPLCGLESETVEHFLLECDYLQEHRQHMLEALPYEIGSDSTSSETMSKLQGLHEGMKTEWRVASIAQVHAFVRATKRFELP